MYHLTVRPSLGIPDRAPFSLPDKDTVNRRKSFYTKRLLSRERIGPHNEEILSTLVGSLLGDGWGEKRLNSTRFHIHAGSPNVEYLYWLHQFFGKRGYCSTDKVKPIKQIGKGGKIYFSYKIRTWSFQSLNFLYELFYEKKRKRIPKEIGSLLSPRALGIWLMDDGGISGKGVKISTESYSHTDLLLLQKALKERYSLVCTIQRHKERWILYFPRSQKPLLAKIVKDYLIPCMYYKLNLEETCSSVKIKSCKVVKV